MSVIRAVLLGYGTVGRGVHDTIQSHQERLVELLGKRVEVVAVLVQNQQKHKFANNILLTTSYDEILSLENIDVIFEAIIGVEPAYTYLVKALEKGWNVITANKEMFAKKGKKLKELACQFETNIAFEATVAGGIPIIRSLKQLLQVNHIHKIEGILNGTSNFILTYMREQGADFTESLKLAQKKGYAEADPTNDVEGWDAFYKIMILSDLVFGEQPDWNTVERAGISDISIQTICILKDLNLKVKHVASIRRTINGIKGEVRPVLVSVEHPLYAVEGVNNAITITSDVVGGITLQGPGAGSLPTASAMIEDLIHVNNESHSRKVVERGYLIEDDKKNDTWLLVETSSEKEVLLQKVQELKNFSLDIHWTKAGYEDGKHLFVFIVSGKEGNLKQLIKGRNKYEYYKIIGKFKRSNLESRTINVG